MENNKIMFLLWGLYKLWEKIKTACQSDIKHFPKYKDTILEVQETLQHEWMKIIVSAQTYSILVHTN